MTPLEMIAEWRKGCSCAATGKPEQCQECALALINALERSLEAQTKAAAVAFSDDPRNTQLRK
jgi:non-homologous end joining protein Ku